MITKGMHIEFKPEYRDSGDESITFLALETPDGGRFKVEAQLGLPINPVQVVTVEMVQRAYMPHTAERPDGWCQFGSDLKCTVCGSGFPGYHDEQEGEL